MSEISSLIEFIKKNPTAPNKEVQFGTVSNKQGQVYNEVAGIKVNLGRKIISTDAIEHVRKRHGLATKESERGQKEIADSDFSLIPSIIINADEMEKGFVSSRGAKAIKFFQTINGFRYCVVMTERVKKEECNDLIFTTMYAKK